MPFAFSAVTAEGVVAERELDSVTVPTGDGEITVLPHHIPLVSTVVPGVLVMRQGADEEHLAVAGGFLQVESEKVTVLADYAERADDIDASRAEAARKRAEDALAGTLEKEEFAETQAALAKSLAQLRASELIKHRKKR